MTGDALMNFVNNILFSVLKGKDIKDPNGNILIKGIQVDPTTPIKKAIVKTTFEDANTYMKDGVLLRQVISVIDELDLSDYEESHAFGEIYETILRELQSAGSSGRILHATCSYRFYGENDQSTGRRTLCGLCLRNRRLFDKLAERAGNEKEKYGRCRKNL